MPGTCPVRDPDPPDPVEKPGGAKVIAIAPGICARRGLAPAGGSDIGIV
jgi:hypothetical protein